MQKEFSKMTRPEKEAVLHGIVSECRALAQEYISNWLPENSTWQVREGCAYLRLSNEEQVSVDKGSLEQQIHIAIAETKIRSQQDKINYKITNFYIEPGITGRHDNRPEFQAMKRAIKRGEFKFIVFKEIARIARETGIWKDFFKLCAEKRCEIFIRGFPFNPNDPTVLVQLDILAAFAEYEANVNSKRVQESVFSALVNSGKFNSTHKVLGLDQLVISGVQKVGLYTPNQEELKIVEWIMRSFIKYASFQKVIDECNERGIKNKDGKPFSKASLRTLLSNQKYIGTWEVNKGNQGSDQKRLMPYQQYVLIELPHGVVINLELWAQVQATLARISGKNHKNTRIDRVYPLSGLLEHEDGTPFGGSGAWGANKSSRNDYYYNKENKVRIPAEALEIEAKNIIADILKQSPKLQDAIAQRGQQAIRTSTLLVGQIATLQNQISEANDELATLNRRLDFVLKDASIETMDGFRAEYTRENAKVKLRITELTKQYDILQKNKAQVDADAFNWREVAQQARKIQDLIQEHDPLALKTAYAALFDKVVVGNADKEGKRPLRFVLKDSDAGDLIRADGNWNKKIMAGVRHGDPATVPPIQTIILSSIQSRIKSFSEEFLRQKYYQERLSIAEIAALTFSAKGTILRQLRQYEIITRKAGSTLHRKNGRGVSFGMRLEKRKLVRHQREQEAIRKMKELRAQGFTLTAIADAFNTMGIPTKTGRAKWTAKTIQQVLQANEK